MSKWIPAWRYVPIDYNQDVAIFENITQKCLFTNNISGTALRLRLSNLYGDTPFTVTHAAVTLRNRVTGASSPAYAVTLNGSDGEMRERCPNKSLRKRRNMPLMKD